MSLPASPSLVLIDQYNETTNNIVYSYSDSLLGLIDNYGDYHLCQVVASSDSGGEFGNGYANLIYDEGDIRLCQIVSGSL